MLHRFSEKKTSVLINNFTVFLIDKRRNSDQNDVSVRLRSVTSITYSGLRHAIMHVTLQSFHSKFQWFCSEQRKFNHFRAFIN